MFRASYDEPGESGLTKQVADEGIAALESRELDLVTSATGRTIKAIAKELYKKMPLPSEEDLQKLFAKIAPSVEEQAPFAQISDEELFAQMATEELFANFVAQSELEEYVDKLKDQVVTEVKDLLRTKVVSAVPRPTARPVLTKTLGRPGEGSLSFDVALKRPPDGPVTPENREKRVRQKVTTPP
jgi:hypothetical protein